MVLSKEVNKTELSDVDKEKFAKLLHEYKPLDCSCCNQLMGFMHRGTGALMCALTCDKVNNVNAVTGSLLSASPTPALLIKKELTETPVENGYKNVSTVKKCEEKPGPSPTYPSPGKSSDAVDHAASPKPVLLPKKNESDLISASNIRKSSAVNPFCRNLPSAKLPELEEDKTKSQVVVEEPRNPVPGSSIVEKVEDVTGCQIKEPEAAPVAPAVVKPRNPFAKPAETSAAVAAPAPAPKVEKPKPIFMWQSCHYSPALEDGASVKTSFVWNVNLLQIVADKDEQLLMAYQNRVNEYVKKSKPMTRRPKLDEMVFADYGGEWYRGRITEIAGDSYKVLFVDFGDARSDLKHTELYDMTPELMEDPIYSAIVRLDSVRSVDKKVKPGATLNTAIYSPLQLQMVEKIDNSTNKEDFTAVLWLGSDKNLNEVVDEVLLQIENEASGLGPSPVKPEDAPIISAFLEYFQVKEAGVLLTNLVNQRNQKKQEASKEIIPLYSSSWLIFSGGKVTYHISDTPLLDTTLFEKDGIISATVTRSRGPDAIYVAPIHPDHKHFVRVISSYAETAVARGDVEQKSFKEDPTTYEMFIVKWLKWNDVYQYLSRMKMTIDHKKRTPSKFNEPVYAPIKQRGNPWEGMWFRAFYRSKVSGDAEMNEIDCSWYCLIDIGITIPVPNKYVYRINFNLMTPPAYTFCIRLILNGTKSFGVTQHSEDLHWDANLLFDQVQNMPIKFKIVGRDSKRCLDVILVEPSEAEFLAKLPNVKKTPDIPKLTEELRGNPILPGYKKAKLDEDQFKKVVLAAVKTHFEQRTNQEENEIKQQMNPFQSATHAKLGKVTEMKMELISSS